MVVKQGNARLRSRQRLPVTSTAAKSEPDSGCVFTAQQLLNPYNMDRTLSNQGESKQFIRDGITLGYAHTSDQSALYT